MVDFFQLYYKDGQLQKIYPMNTGIVLYLKSGYVIFDEEDFNLISSYNWRVNNNGYVTYLQYSTMILRPTCLLLHRMILGVSGDEVVDHINHNPQDNRRCNLRIATTAQNVRNRISNRKSTSKYLGVSFCSTRNKWKSQIKADGRMRTIGRFENESGAAAAYNVWATKYFGEFANLNKIG